MRTFTVDDDNNITVFASREEARKQDGVLSFTSQKELETLAHNWPSGRLVEIWNSFAGVAPFDKLKPVKKFTDRKTAVARIWNVVQTLDAPGAPQAATDAPKPEATTKKATREKKATTAREGSKKAQVLELLQKPQGATLKEIMAATDWQAHSVRGFISGSIVKKMGLKIESVKLDGERAYKLAE